MRNSFARRYRDWIIAIGIAVAIFCIALGVLITLSLINIYHAHAQAVADLPAAESFLRSNHAYDHVQVDVSGHHGAGLWFTGYVVSQEQCDHLESELGKKFDNKEYELMFTVFTH